jgi:antitoxin CptB
MGSFNWRGLSSQDAKQDAKIRAREWCAAHDFYPRALYIKNTPMVRADGACLFEESAVSGPSISTADLDPRQRRILFRAWHRGMKEMDLIFGQFADAHVQSLDPQALDLFEELMECADRDVLMWITEEASTPSHFNTSLFQAIKDFHSHHRPLFKS